MMIATGLTVEAYHQGADARPRCRDAQRIVELGIAFEFVFQCHVTPSFEARLSAAVLKGAAGKSLLPKKVEAPQRRTAMLRCLIRILRL